MAKRLLGGIYYHDSGRHVLVWDVGPSLSDRVRRRLHMVRDRVATVLFGRHYANPHDYVSLRLRYSHHRGAYGNSWKWRLFELVVTVSRRHGRFGVTVKPVSRERDPHWREREEPRIAKGW